VPTKNSFLQKVTWLFSGLFLVQVINLSFALLLPKIYSPQNFSLFGIFISTVLIFSEIVNLRLDQALMIPKNEEESIFIYKKAIKSATIISFIVSIGIGIYYFSPWYHSEYSGFLWIPLSIILQGWIQPTLSYCNRVQAYKKINTSRVLQALIMGLVSCLPFILYTKKIFLIEGYIAGQFISLIFLIPLIYKNLNYKIETKNLSIQPFIKFPKYGTFSSLLNTISRNSVIYILNFFFTPYLVGLYTFTNRLVQAPIGLVTSSIGQAYFRDASMAENSQELKRLTFSIERILAIIAVVPVSIALLWGPNIFEFLFGTEWRGAGEIARYLALWYGTSLIVTPLSMLIDVKGHLKWELGYNFIFAIFRIGVLIWGGLWGDFKWTMILFCIVSVVFNLYLLVYIRQLVQHEN
jgi:O-antigen/teichoic acid export membrane protein